MDEDEQRPDLTDTDLEDDDEPQPPSAEEEDQLDEAIEDAEDEAAPEPEPDAEEEAEAPQPAPFVATAGEDADDLALKELMTPEAYAAMRRVMQRDMSRALQSMSAANIHVTTAAAQHPEIFRVYGARIQHSLSQLPEALRAKPEGVNVAIANLLLEEANSKGIGAALSKLAAMAASEKAAPAPKPPKAPIPAAQRPPSPSNGVRPLNRESRVQREMAKFGISGRALDDLMEDLG